MEENGYDSKSEAEEEKPKPKNGAFKRFQMSDRELDDYVEADSRMDAMAERMNAERPGYMDEYERNPEERERVRESALMHIQQERSELDKYVNHQPYQGTIKDESKEGKAIKRRFRKAGFKKLMRRYTGDDPKLYYRAPPEKIDVWPPVDAKPWGHLPWRDPIESSPEDPYTQDDLDSELPMRQPVLPDLYHDKLVPPQEVDMIARALELRERGNEAYKNDDLNDAVDQYTYAAESLEAEAGVDGGGKPRAESVLGIVLSNRALCLLKLGRFAEAVAPAARALSLSSVAAQPALAGKTYSRLALAQLESGDIAGSIGTAYHAAKLGHLKYLHRDLRDYDEVKKAAEKPRVSLVSAVNQPDHAADEGEDGFQRIKLLFEREALPHPDAREPKSGKSIMSEAVEAMGHSRAQLGGKEREGSEQHKRANFPTSKAPISAIFHSFRLIFGRAIISRHGEGSEHPVARMIDLVIKRGGTAKARYGADAHTLIMTVAYAQQPRAIERLLRAGARAAKESEIPNFKGSYLGRFPLAGADATCVDSNGWTALHYSVHPKRTCHTKDAVLAVLTRARCPLDAVNIDGVTALAIAAIDGNGRAVKKLLALGANPTVRGALGHSALGLCIVQPRCASEVGVHNSEGSTTEKDPEVDVCMDNAVRRYAAKKGGGDYTADEDTRVALVDHWLEKIRQIRQPGHREPDVPVSAQMYDFSDMIPKSEMKKRPPETFPDFEDYIDPARHYATLHPDAQRRRARDVESCREMLKDCKLNYKRPEKNAGNPFFAIHDRSLDRMPTVMKRHFRGRRVAAANPGDEPTIVLDEEPTKDEVGWLVGLCSLAPLVDPASPEFDTADDDRADDAVCADTNPEVDAAPKAHMLQSVDETGDTVWLVSGRRRQMDRLIRGPASRVFTPMCPNDACIRVVHEYGPIVHPGARGGYWAKMLRDAGAHVVALDEAPHGSKPTAAGLEPPLVAWTEVTKGSFADVAAWSDHTLLLVWPRQCFGWAQEDADTPDDLLCLEKFMGTTLIFVGNRSGTSAATEKFHNKLNTTWKLTRACAIPCWPGQEADLTVWTR
ncbi:hypothetical protein AURANDRAFT_65157 [Aureococcus anophagefferens]|uniref:Uncharacterized protein n=1 Tax=Aureococcus anophagefferens TaxID=44056 RepID=F0YCW6_AURAN|nr:hypothetical protein AURANDRAFT_65157 [Aureococcus anophagefferens]EGB06959.1 hypothetical protein AURANDRAFT_65157 [Aureococcus anophagefferens]|eukprot:XP_009038201.1 hypothetical protein AURANDRAFT_65157 [Aureococcus anophagefferens]